MMFRCVAALSSCAILSLASLPATAADPYRLGPGDHVEVRVTDFRAGSGEAYLWSIFSTGTTDFIVGADGRLSLPVLGQIDAEGRTVAELEEAIATNLQAKVNLTSRPDASVQIAKYRPFYVSGIVDKPGAYEYQPGLTVLAAVSLAGGLRRVTSDALIGLEKDALNSRGDLRTLAADLDSLMARQARLDAEIGDKPQIQFPDELQTKSVDSEVARAMREEQLLFDARRANLVGQQTALERNKDFLHAEIDQLRQKDATIATQLVAMRKELDLIAGLLSKGLTGAPRQLELEQNIGQVEGNQLDVQVAIVRSNEDISKSDRDILDLRAKSRDDALKEEEEVRVKLVETVEKIQTARALITEAEDRAPEMAQARANGDSEPTYRISRRGDDGKVKTTAAEEDDLVRPGDILRVLSSGADATGLSTNSATHAN